jgi:Flp pilus assembly protein TadD
LLIICLIQGSTAVLLNGQAVSYIAQGKYPEAEAALSEALEKDSNNPETLVNMIVLSQLTGKQPEVGVKFIKRMIVLNESLSLRLRQNL